MTPIDLSAIEADFASLPPKGADGRTCQMQLLAKEHPEAEALLRQAVASTQYSTRVVAEVLTRHGLKISDTCIRKHRAGRCTLCQGASSE